jgi:S1-C subfamily serine protease
MAVMDNRPDFIVRRSRPSIVRTARRISVAITLGLVLGASASHAGVPLPVVAETTGMPSLAAVVKRIAPSVVGIESRGRVAAEPDTKRRQARKGVGPVLAARSEIHLVGSGVVFDARRGLIITNSHVIDHADDITVRLTVGNPQQIGQTVSAGIVSGLHRTNVGIGPYEDFIQTDRAAARTDSRRSRHRSRDRDWRDS